MGHSESDPGVDCRSWEGTTGWCPTMHRRVVVPQLLGLEKTHAPMSSEVISESVDPVRGRSKIVVGQESPAMAASRLSLMTIWSRNS